MQIKPKTPEPTITFSINYFRLVCQRTNTGPLCAYHKHGDFFFYRFLFHRFKKRKKKEKYKENLGSNSILIWFAISFSYSQYVDNHQLINIIGFYLSHPKYSRFKISDANGTVAGAGKTLALNHNVDFELGGVKKYVIATSEKKGMKKNNGNIIARWYW